MAQSAAFPLPRGPPAPRIGELRHSIRARLGACPQSPYSSRPSPQPQELQGRRIVVRNFDLFNRPCEVCSIGRAAYGRGAGNRSPSVFARSAAAQLPPCAQGRHGEEKGDFCLPAPGTGSPQLVVTETLTIGRSGERVHVLASAVA